MIDYEVWSKTLKNDITDEISDKKISRELMEDLKDEINKKSSFLHPNPSKFLSNGLYPLLPKIFPEPKLVTALLDLLKSIIQNSSHELEFYSEIVMKILIETMLAGRGGSKLSKAVIKAFLKKTRNWDILWDEYVETALKGKFRTTDHVGNDGGYSVAKRSRGVRLLKDIIAMDNGNILQGIKEDGIDTCFWRVRQAVELILAYYLNKKSPISLKDASRNALMGIMKKYNLDMLKQNLSSKDRESLEDIEGKYIKKKYESKLSRKLENKMPELVAAHDVNPDLMPIPETLGLEDGTVELDNIAIDARKIELKFGRLEFEDKAGNKHLTLNPKIYGPGALHSDNDDLSDEDADLSTKDSTKSSKRRRRKKKRKKGSRRSKANKLTKGAFNSLNPFSNDLNIDEFLSPFNEPQDNLLLRAKNGLIWDFMPIALIKETLDFSANWTTRQISLEQVCVRVRSKANLNKPQMWGLIRYVYVMFCQGKKIEFLAKIGHKKEFRDEAKKKDRTEANKHLYVKRNLRRKIVIKKANGKEVIVKEKGYWQVDREMDVSLIDDSGNEIQTEYATLLPPKAKILLLLIAEKVISYRSNLLYEPLIASLGDEHIGVRRLAFKILSNTQRLFKSKLSSLMLTYQQALGFENAWMRVQLLNLILVMIYRSGQGYTLQKLIRPVQLLTLVARFLDSENIKLKLTAMNCLIGICKFWPDYGAQEILREILEEEVYGYLLDRLDSGRLDLEMLGLDKNATAENRGTYLEYEELQDLGDKKSHDFVREIVEKEREFMEKNQGLLRRSGNDPIGSSVYVLNASEPDVRRSQGSPKRPKNGRNASTVTNPGQSEVQDTLDEKTGLQKSPQNAQNSKNHKKKAVAFFVDMKAPKLEKEKKDFVYRVPDEYDYNKKLKGDRMKYIVDYNAQQYKNYKGQDLGLRFNKIEDDEDSEAKKHGEDSDSSASSFQGDELVSVKTVSKKKKKKKKRKKFAKSTKSRKKFPKEDPNGKVQQEIDNVIDEYMTQFEQYDGEYNELDSEDEGYAAYKRMYDLPKNVRAFKSYRKKMKKQKKLEFLKNQKKRKKPNPRPISYLVLKDHELMFISADEASKFLENFIPRMDDLMDYDKVLEDINTLRGVALHHPDLLLLGDNPMANPKSSIPLSTLIDHLCTCIDLEDPKIQAAVLALISYLSFTYKRVMTAHLSALLSTLFTLFNKTSEADIRQRTLRTLKTLSKYSGDVKFMAYILLMPAEMRTRYKRICCKMLDCMVARTPISAPGDQAGQKQAVRFPDGVPERDKSNLNIFVLEDQMIGRLIKYAAEWFGDVADDIRQSAESLICGIWERFRDHKRSTIFFWWLKKLVRLGQGGEADLLGIGEEFLKHPLNPHYQPESFISLETENQDFSRGFQRVGYGDVYKKGISKKRAVLITKYLKQNFGDEVKEGLNQDVVDPAGKGVEFDKQLPADDNVFRRSGTNILAGFRLGVNGAENGGFEDPRLRGIGGLLPRSGGGVYESYSRKPKFFGERGGGGRKRGRDHKLQDDLMQQIDNLISS